MIRALRQGYILAFLRTYLTLQWRNIYGLNKIHPQHSYAEYMKITTKCGIEI
jgi:hypothetical protein